VVTLIRGHMMSSTADLCLLTPVHRLAKGCIAANSDVSETD